MSLMLVHPFDPVLVEMLKAYKQELGLDYDPCLAEDAQLCHLFRNSDGVAVGFVRGRSISVLRVYRIESIYVRPELRRNGYAMSMLDMVDNSMRSGGWGYSNPPRAVEFCAPSDNVAATGLAVKAGFATTYTGFRRGL